MRHRRRADLAGLELLAEEAKRDVAPDVAVEVDQDGIGAGEGVEKLGHRVMRLDLNGIGVEFQPQTLDKAAREAFPVVRRVGREVGIVVADRTVDLAQEADPDDGLARPVETIDDVGQLLAHGRRRRGLAVRARHHRQFGELVRQFAQAGDHLVQRRNEHRVARALEHQRVREVVDVLGGAGKVDEFLDPHHLSVGGELILDPVFERLDVVIGGRLDGFHLGGLLRPEFGNQAIELGDGRWREGRDLGEMRLGGQRLEPFDLDLQAAADQAELGKVLAQSIDLGRVTTVERREHRQVIARHGWNPSLRGRHCNFPAKTPANPAFRTRRRNEGQDSECYNRRIPAPRRT